MTHVIYSDFMNIYFEDVFSESCTPASYKTPNDYFKVNLLSLHEILFNLYIIIKPELFHEIAALSLGLISTIIPNCRGVIVVGW